MSVHENQQTILHADPEHGGLRFVVMLVLIINIIVGFLLIQLLINLFASGTLLYEFTTVLSCVLSIPFALAVSWIVETVLKREWPSGKSLMLEEDRFLYEFPPDLSEDSDDQKLRFTFDWSKRVNILYWYFELNGYPRAGRERRVSNKWLGLACQLHQDESRIIAYCYLPPNSAEKWIENNDLSQPFVKISLADLYEKAGQIRRSSASKRPSIDASLLTSAEGRYWLAEQRRWKHGVELTGEDFDTFINYIEEKVQT